MGMACVATPVGAVPEIAAEGGLLLVPVGNVSTLADTIAELVASPELRKRLGAQARSTICTHYVGAVVLSRLAQTYRKLLLAANQVSVAPH